MPEEVNRIVTDVLSDLLFAPSQDAVVNLKKEGIPDEKVHLVGNAMIDTLLACLERAKASGVLAELSVEPGHYFLATLHRPSNVDDPRTLMRVADILAEVGVLRPTILAAHPRTLERLHGSKAHARLQASGVHITQPLGYLDFLKLMANAAAVLTDSGGIQEETTVLGIPCITLRDTTERPITVTEGTNLVTGLNLDAVLAGIREAMSGRAVPRRPHLWDGRTAERIIEVLTRQFGSP
jgi:UDP-N-acetylglucosamine 2-epimerase (non-hydrolysing)